MSENFYDEAKCALLIAKWQIATDQPERDALFSKWWSEARALRDYVIWKHEAWCIAHHFPFPARGYDEDDLHGAILQKTLRGKLLKKWEPQRGSTFNFFFKAWEQLLKSLTTRGYGKVGCLTYESDFDGPESDDGLNAIERAEQKHLKGHGGSGNGYAERIMEISWK